MGVLRLIKDLQAELMTGKDLPHLVSVRLLARLDEAERHCPAAPQPPKGEQVGTNLDGGPSSGTPAATLGVTEEK